MGIIDTLSRELVEARAEIRTLRASHDRRVTELLEANNRYQQEARDARTALRAAEDKLREAQQAASGLKIVNVIDMSANNWPVFDSSWSFAGSW